MSSLSFHLDHLKYGNLNRAQEEVLARGPHPKFGLRFEDVPLMNPPANSSEESLRELEFLRRAMDRPLLDPDLVRAADEDLAGLFRERLAYFGLPEPDWFEDFGEGMGRYIVYLKNYYQRPRPYQLAAMLGEPYAPHRTFTGHSPAYPSGHSAQALGLALGLELEYGDGYGFRTLGKHISYSRIQLGVHYPSDRRYGEILGRLFFRLYFT